MKIAKKRKDSNKRRKLKDEAREELGFLMFWSRCPELAEEETRTFLLSEETGGVPPGAYSFLEFYCTESGCDCRRVIFQVMWEKPDGSHQHILNIGYGWEDLEFYQRWYGGTMREKELNLLKGPSIEPLGPFVRFGPALLDLFCELALSSEDYVERLKRHYRIFRES